MFDLSGKVIAITGGTGILGSEIAVSLAEQGCQVALLDLKTEIAADLRQRLAAAKGDSLILYCNVLDKASLLAAKEQILEKFGRIDALINGAGGNHPKATKNGEVTFFDIPDAAFAWVLQLNLTGMVLPSQVFGKYFAEQGAGNILNISSMNAFRPLTRIPAYSAAKAAVSNFARWLAVHMA